MRPVLPIHLSHVDQTDVILVDERRRLKALTGAFPSQTAPSDPMELPFDCRDEARQRFFIAAPPRQEQARYIGKQSSNAQILRRLPLFLGFGRVSRLRARGGRRSGPDDRTTPSCRKSD